jgi:AraC family transcriptional regulator of adaptative response/methylated-DNA-[protein]-cysteine methyltransferase
MSLDQPLQAAAPDHESRYHYALMRRAIERIDAEGGAGTSLEALAGEMNLSPAHFQRVFSAWAGVSPKRFGQYLALGHAKALLRDRASVLEAATGTGLSGTGRLHDLFLRWEAMSPGEYAKGGAGLEIGYGWFDGPFGEMLVMATSRGICGLALSAETGRAAAWDDMAGRWPRAAYRKDRGALAPMVEAILGQSGEARLHLIGAPFQIKVWEALMRVPTGRVTTYGAIAASIGSPRAVRAVGTAVGRNPVSWLIPCHRALRKSGGLGGYHWGLPVKRAILAWETARTETG